jgi:glucosamine--fructose-6-phosphate aminotransferase (isomerizing)
LAQRCPIAESEYLIHKEGSGMERGTHTYHEIISQPEAWAEALDVVEKSRDGLKNVFDAHYDQVVFTGCGSTYYLSLAAAALFQQMTGRSSRAVPGGELLLNPQTALSGGSALLVAVSRSGSTTETVRAVEQFKKQRRGPVLAITNYGNQPLAGLADVALVIEKGQEESVAQTRSFASMYMAASAMTMLAAGQEQLRASMRSLPGICEKLIDKYEALAQKIGENLGFERFYFLGSGGRYGLACEVSLKMKEMTLTHSEPFHFLEFRHGPMSMVNKNTVVVGMLSEANRAHEQKVLGEMQELGATLFSIADAEAVVNFESGLPEALRGSLYLPAVQLLAYYRSMAKDLNPDSPNNLTAVVSLDLP